MTLRWRLVTLYASLAGLLLAVIALTVYTSLDRYLKSNLDRELDNSINQARKVISTWSLVSGGRTVNWNLLPDTIYGQVQIVVDPNDLSIASFYDPNDNLKRLGIGARIELDIAGKRRLKELYEKNEEGIYRGSGIINSENGENKIAVLAQYLPSVVRFNVLTNRFETIYYPTIIYVALGLSGIDNTLGGLRTILFVVLGFGLAIAGAGSYIFSGRVLAPIKLLGEAAAGIGGAELSKRVPEPGTKDEVDALAQVLNQMLARLEESFETQRRFTADASHELRTPITAIIGHANFLLRRSNPSEMQKESLEIIRSEGTRLSKLVGNLLDLARADAGFPLEKVLVDLKNLAEEVHREIAPIAGETEILVIGNHITLRADPQRLRQVFLNLVQNAIQAGAKRIEIRLQKVADKAVISIEDDGPGIAPEHLPKLFTRFYRVDSARNKAMGGSGLGLSIVKWIIEAHGGNVTVASKIGVGTRFEITI